MTIGHDLREYMIKMAFEEIQTQYPRLYSHINKDYENNKFSLYGFYTYFANLVGESENEFNHCDDVIRYIKEHEELIDFWIL